MKTGQEEEDVAEDHIEEEAEVEGVKHSTNPLLSVIIATSSDTFNMSVQVGAKKPILLSLMKRKQCY